MEPVVILLLCKKVALGAKLFMKDKMEKKTELLIKVVQVIVII